MDSAIIEYAGSPLDNNLLTSWKRFSLQSSNSSSESEGEEVEFKQDDLLEQLKQLSFIDVPSKYSNENAEINSGKDQNTEKLIFTKNEIDENQLVSTSSTNKKILNKYTNNSHKSVDSDGEDIEKSGTLLQQLKKLSFNDVSDSKDESSKYSIKTPEINTQEQTNVENLIFLDEKESHEDWASSSLNSKLSDNNVEGSSTTFVEDEPDSNQDESENVLQQLKNLSFVDVTDSKVVSPKRSDKFAETKSLKKNKPKQRLFVDSTKINEKQLSSLVLKNNNFSKGYSDTPAATEFEFEDEDDEKPVILRERHPIRHQRPENNRQFRTIPFPQNHSRACNQSIDSNGFQTHGNNHSRLNHLNFPHNSCNSLNENRNTHLREYHQISPHIQSLRGDEAFEGYASNAVEIPTVNDVPMLTEEKIGNDIIIVNDVFPFAVEDEIFDRVVPSLEEMRYVNEPFSEEVNDSQNFDNIREKIFNEAFDKNCAVANGPIETFIDRRFANHTAENVDYRISQNQGLESLTELNLDSFVNPYHLDLIKISPLLPVLSGEEVETICGSSCRLTPNSSVESTFEDFPRSNEYNFQPEPDHYHSLFPNTNTYRENGVLEGEFHNHDCITNKSGNYSSMISENVTSINGECLSPQTSEYLTISEEIDEIVKWTEMLDWVSKGQNNVSENPHHVAESWKVLPYVEMDSNAISECHASNSNTPEHNLSNKGKKEKKKKNCSESKGISQTRKQAYKVEEPKIIRIWSTAARDKLLRSPSFSETDYKIENEKMRRQLENGELGTKEKPVIHFLKKNRKTKYRGTNLHYAVLSGNTEKVVCIVETHKKCHNTTHEINSRDSSNKTVLDYAKEKSMDLLANYLEENEAILGVRV